MIKQMPIRGGQAMMAFASVTNNIFNSNGDPWISILDRSTWALADMALINVQFCEWRVTEAGGKCIELEICEYRIVWNPID